MYVRYFVSEENRQPKTLLMASGLDAKIRLQVAESQLNRLDELTDELDIYEPEDNVFTRFFNNITKKRKNKKIDELREYVKNMRLLLGEIIKWK